MINKCCLSQVKQLQRVTNYFILSLAFADFIVATFVVNFHTMYMIVDWPYNVLNYHVCLLWLTVDYWVFQVSVFGVLLIAGDRWVFKKWFSYNNHHNQPGKSHLRCPYLFHISSIYLSYHPLYQWPGEKKLNGEIRPDLAGNRGKNCAQWGLHRGAARMHRGFSSEVNGEWGRLKHWNTRRG